MGLFVWYFGAIAATTTSPSHHPCSVRVIASCSKDIFVRKTLAEDFSLYLHRPTATDRSLAPPEGCDTFYVLSPVPNLQGGQDWRMEAEPYRSAKSRRCSNRACSPDFLEPSSRRR